MLITYSLSDISDYIDWLYFFHAWGFPPKYAEIATIHGCDACRHAWVSRFPTDERQRAQEAINLFSDAQRELSRMSRHVSIRCLVELHSACSKDEDILLFLDGESTPIVLPMLRQQRPGQDGYCLCLSDFLPEESDGERGKLGLFATSVTNSTPPISSSESVRPAIGSITNQDAYHSMLVQTLSERLAEAGAERLHQEVLTKIWGYCKDEKLAIGDLLHCRYQGIRPAVGYPCLPDISLNFLLDSVLDLSRIGIDLTEHGMMIPHASVSGLMFSAPEARYFAIGSVSDDQLSDYARRRGMAPTEIRKYIKC